MPDLFNTARMKYLLKSLLKDVYYFPIDTVELILGKRPKLIPPRRIRGAAGDGDFMVTGEEFLGYFVDLGGLRPHHRILDVGSGNGRMAVALTKLLVTGSYEGFDIVQRGIDWSTKVISSEFPNFHFQVADVYNRSYHPAGKQKASEYRFPFANESFDFVILTSVFTHMLPDDMVHYFSEISRVLRKGGTTLISYFLINEESSSLIDRRYSKLDFSYAADGYRCISQAHPEDAIAFSEATIRNLYQSHGFQIVEPVRYGSWCGRDEFLSFQDIIIGKKG